MRITLLRHAPTADNLLGRYIGRSDPPLCGEGVALARQIGPDYEVKRVYSSPMRRTMETAALLYPAARIIPRAGLEEMDFGVFEGKNWRELEQDSSYRIWVEGGCLEPCPGGEGRDGFITRCVAAFRGILEESEAEGEEQTHVVAHGGTVMAALSVLAGPGRDYFDWKADFCGGYLLEYNPAAEARPLTMIKAIRAKAYG